MNSVLALLFFTLQPAFFLSSNVPNSKIQFLQSIYNTPYSMVQMLTPVPQQKLPLFNTGSEKTIQHVSEKAAEHSSALIPCDHPDADCNVKKVIPKVTFIPLPTVIPQPTAIPDITVYPLPTDPEPYDPTPIEPPPCRLPCAPHSDNKGTVECPMIEPIEIMPCKY